MPHETATAQTRVVIPPRSGHAFRLAKGQLLRVTDVEGEQVADLVAYNAADTSECLSQGFTRMYNSSTAVSTGDHLFTNRNNPILTITEDPVGVHDFLYPPCNRVYYERVPKIEGKTGCRDHLLAALEPLGFDLWQITDPFNIFMNTGVDDAGRPTIFRPKSRAGDYIEFRAEMDVIVGVSACADDTSVCNGGVCTSIAVEILDAPAG
ncbi:DUF1989 domain-containing protein [Mycolicibacterium phlei]|uniref:DUF1989 domain-containing protein n=1 Tax=Mycolicibacterium phlei TaxID=1771 RepID=UPI00025AF343|nr:urea carboxylase-associated family protein [Mycolicibacterium phlei]EID09280.1 hypothetical protein MPHLEI_25061 [Mycolicibacterium phlei RIVM601174]MBF4192217.1 hypothetical protein [Mycolicibacterium phlei]